MMDKNYGVVLIGCGHIGEEHIQDIYFREGITIAGVVDMNIENAKFFAKRFGAESYSVSYQQYLSDPAVDIVIIATYTNTHLPIFKDCIAAGKHVLCEKPMTLDIEELEEFRAIAENARTKVHVGHILRYNQTYKKVKEMIQNDVIGRPLVMRMVQNHHTMNWERYKRLLKDCSPVLDCGVHYFDVMQWFTDAKIQKVFGLQQKIDADLEDCHFNYGLVNVMLSDGSVGYYEVGWSNSMAADNLKEFIGPKGRIRIEYQSNRFRNKEEGDLIEYYDSVNKVYHSINLPTQYKPMWEQLKSLIYDIENNRSNIPHIETAYSATKAAMAADLALQTGTMVEIKQ